MVIKPKLKQKRNWQRMLINLLPKWLNIVNQQGWIILVTNDLINNVLSSNYCRCRHAVFSDYFGDNKPNCVNRCDVCSNKSKVEKLISQYQNSTMKTLMSKLQSTDECELYEGGRIKQNDYEDVNIKIYKKLYLLCNVVNLFLFSSMKIMVVIMTVKRK